MTSSAHNGCPVVRPDAKKRLVMTTRPVDTRRPDAAESVLEYSVPPHQPLAGVSSSIITAAARRVAQRVRDAGVEPADMDIPAAFLAAIALAVDQQHPRYVTELVRRASPRLGTRLLEMLRAEVIRGWAANTDALDPAAMLRMLEAMERVRDAIEPEAAHPLADRLSEPGGLDLVVEIAHDLRSPLTSILFLSETLQTGLSGDVNEFQHHQLALIYSAALSLSALVSNAIELARGGDRLVDNEPCPFSIHQTLDAVRYMLRPTAADLRIGYPVALSRALLNLTCNALQFTEHGLVEIAAGERDGSRVE